MARRKRPCPPHIPARLRDLALSKRIGVTMKCTSQGPIYTVQCPGKGQYGHAHETVSGTMANVRHAARSAGCAGRR